MSNQIASFVKKLEKPFSERNSQQLNWRSESGYALQQITRNDFTLKTAANNQKSLQSAILNVSAIGLSLNPATAYAYLVPRDGCVCLDISYRGLLKLAVDSGAILWVKSELVYRGDEFQYRGPIELPIHKADVFADGREPTPQSIVGVYTVAKTPSSDYLVDIITSKELEIIRQSSKAKNGPWHKYYGEMCLKSAIKRAAKRWPPGQSNRLDSAIDVINQHEGIVIESIKAADTLTHSPEQKGQFDAAITAGDDMALYCMQQEFGSAVSTSLYNSFPKGEVTKFKRIIDDMSHRGHKAFSATVDTLHALISAGDDSGVAELMEELTNTEKSMAIDSLSGEEIQFIREVA